MDAAPFVPLLTTPEISLEQFSPNPVGASNATTGLIAGATNSTLSQIQGSTSSVYTVPVWYQGGGSADRRQRFICSPRRLDAKVILCTARCTKNVGMKSLEKSVDMKSVRMQNVRAQKRVDAKKLTPTGRI